MRILYQPKTTVLECSVCQTAVEIDMKDLWISPHDTFFSNDANKEDWDELHGDVFQAWKDRYVVACPTCSTIFDTDDVVKTENVYKKIRGVCKACRVPLGQDDVFCNSCGTPVHRE